MIMKTAIKMFCTLLLGTTALWAADAPAKKKNWTVDQIGGEMIHDWRPGVI